MRRILWVIVTLSTRLWASGFEGSITWIKQSPYDTTFYTYYISNDRIRIEEKDNKKNIRHVYLININKEEVFIIDPAKKMYTKLKKSTSRSKDANHFIVKKTNNYKIIKGVKCYQWRVKNVHRNCEITYWVAQKNFDFFDKMVKVLNNTDKGWEYFNSIPHSSGYFPMLYEERTLLRDKRMQTSVIKIEQHRIDSSIFQIPKDYILFIM
ncbi:MAG: DUF4412 domain-containing protein [Bacteroidales bacterium]|nr:DUF4412 domain-containing protein [Bacteroidales bacterium]